MSSVTQESGNLDASGEACPRRISEPLLVELRQLFDQLATCDTLPPAEWRKKAETLLRRVILDAGFLGFPRASRLGRSLLNALPHLPEGENAKAFGALRDAFSLLLSLCRTPGSDVQMHVEAALKMLETSLSVDHETLLRPIDLYKAPSERVESRQSGDSVAVREHTDHSIYSSAIIDSMDRCAEEESWTVSQLAAVAEDLACSTEKVRPAHRLMSVLRGHRFFRRVDRLCLAGLVRGSNQLVVVDSCVSQRLRSHRDENPMQRGYSCFVNPQGSLFRMKPGVLRVFDDCSRVLQSFSKQGRPAQRSIAHIADTGLRSGLCLAIGRGDSVQGFLFMNSMEPDLFEGVTQRFAPLLSLFSLLGTVAFDTAGFHVELASTAGDEPSMNQATEFTPEHFRQMLEATVASESGAKTEIELSVDGLPRFLYLPRTIVGAVAEVLAAWRAVREAGAARLDFAMQGEQVVIRCEAVIAGENGATGGNLDRVLQRCRSSFRECPLQIDRVGDMAEFRFPVEPIFENAVDCAYSVAY